MCSKLSGRRGGLLLPRTETSRPALSCFRTLHAPRPMPRTCFFFLEGGVCLSPPEPLVPTRFPSADPRFALPGGRALSLLPMRSCLAPSEKTELGPSSICFGWAGWVICRLTRGTCLASTSQQKREARSVSPHSDSPSGNEAFGSLGEGCGRSP